MNVVFHPQEQISEWVRVRLPGAQEAFGPHTSLGVEYGGKLICGIVYRNYLGHDITLDIAAESPRWCQKGILRAIFAYPFIQLECARVTGIQPATNERAHRLVEGLGFTKEGVIRLGWDGEQDAWLYGLLKTECRWIEELNDGQQVKA